MHICHVNCPHIASKLAMPSRVLRVPTVLNQVKFIWNFVFVKLFTISKKVCARFSKNIFRFGSITKKERFSPILFVEYFYKDIHNLGIKIIYQNSEPWIIFNGNIQINSTLDSGWYSAISNKLPTRRKLRKAFPANLDIRKPKIWPVI